MIAGWIVTWIVQALKPLVWENKAAQLITVFLVWVWISFLVDASTAEGIVNVYWTILDWLEMGLEAAGIYSIAKVTMEKSVHDVASIDKVG